METLTTAKEIAKKLNTGEQRIYDLVRKGLIPVIRLGERQYRFSETAVQRWADNGGSMNGGETDESETN
jgi:excisionase family DNA binding protein